MKSFFLVLIFGAPFINATSLVLYADDIPIKTNQDTLTCYFEDTPSFPGGSDSMQSFIKSHLQFPTGRIEDEIEGRVLVSCIVTKNGKITNVKIRKSLYPTFDKEAIRIVKLFPDFKIPRRKNPFIKRKIWKLAIPITFKHQ